MIALLVWIVAWALGGAPGFEVGDNWFWFLVACGGISLSQAIAVSRIGTSAVTVLQPPPQRSADESEDGEQK